MNDSVQLDIEDDIIEKKKDKTENYFDWEDEKTNINDDIPNSVVNYNNLGTTQSYRFLNMSLIATYNPEKFALHFFSDLIQDIKNADLNNDCKSFGSNKVKSFKNLNKIYEQQLAKYNEKEEFLIKNTKNKEDLDKILQTNDKPQLNFPDFCQINTLEHIKHYAKSNMKKIIKNFVRSKISIENIPINSYLIDDDLKLLLCAGIGVISINPSDYNYNSKVLELASDGRLAYLISDSSICYGTNYPINRVFITDEFALKHSINTIFQLMGRAGRVGKSWKAEIYVTNDIAKRIINYARNLDEADIEANNMNISYFKCLQNEKIRMNKKIEELTKKFNFSEGLSVPFDKKNEKKNRNRKN
jgi:hypothetical protein